MKVNDKVVLKKMYETNAFWSQVGVNCNSVGVIASIDIEPGVTILTVKWNNGATSTSTNVCFEFYKSENIPLPNLEFKRRKDIK